MVEKMKILLIILIFIIILINGCISNNNHNGNDQNVNAEYMVIIETNKTINYTIICPIALPTGIDPIQYNDYLNIINGNGTFKIEIINENHPELSNLSSTYLGDRNLYGLKINSNNNITVQYRIHTNKLHSMSLYYQGNYFVYLNSSSKFTHKIKITAYSEPGDSGNDYYSDFHILDIGWQKMTIIEGGWDE